MIDATDLMVRTHHLGRAPSLVDAQVADDVGHLHIAVLPTGGGSSDRRSGWPRR